MRLAERDRQTERQIDRQDVIGLSQKSRKQIRKTQKNEKSEGEGRGIESFC